MVSKLLIVLPNLFRFVPVTSKKKFWNPRKWFKRKSNKVSEDISPSPEIPDSNNVKETIRSRSTSELSETDEPIRRRLESSLISIIRFMNL